MTRFKFGPVALGLLFTLSATAYLSATSTQGAQATSRQESLAIGVLRSIASAEATHSAKYGRPASLTELVRKRCLAARIRNGAELDGYRIGEVSVDPVNKTWEFKAEPVDESQGMHAFNIGEDFAIRYQDGLIAPKGKMGKLLGGD